METSRGGMFQSNPWPWCSHKNWPKVQLDHVKGVTVCVYFETSKKGAFPEWFLEKAQCPLRERRNRKKQPPRFFSHRRKSITLPQKATKWDPNPIWDTFYRIWYALVLGSPWSGIFSPLNSILGIIWGKKPSWMNRSQIVVSSVLTV